LGTQNAADLDGNWRKRFQGYWGGMARFEVSGGDALFGFGGRNGQFRRLLKKVPQDGGCGDAI
jgi:hypothetical protein